MFEGLTVSIATRDRSELLQKVVARLANNGELGCPVDVIIDSRDDLKSVAVCKALETTYGSSFRWFKIDSKGLAAARNFGAKVCRTTHIRFQDDDDVLQFTDLRLLSIAHYEKPDKIFLTNTKIDSRFHRPFVTFLTEDPGYVFNYDYVRRQKTLKYDCFWGGRTSLPVSALKEQQFDEDFVFGCEDIELGYRLLKTNIEIEYLPHIWATQIRDFTVTQFMFRTFHQGFSQGVLASKYQSGELNEWATHSLILDSADSFDLVINQLKNLFRESVRLDLPANLLDSLFDKESVGYAYWIWNQMYTTAKQLGFSAFEAGLSREETLSKINEILYQ